MNLAEDLLAAGDPDGVAIIAGQTEITHGQLRRRVAVASRRLRGFARQDRVAIWAENGPFFVVSYLAVMRAGLVAVPIHSETAPEAARRIFHDAGARLILASEKFSGAARRAAADDIPVVSEGESDAALSDLPEPVADVDPHDLAALMFTSGSTGAPKGVMVTHGNIACNTQDIVQYIGLTASDRCLVVLPFSYCFGLSLLHTHLAAGGSVVINNSFRYPETILSDLQNRRCTGLAGVPSTYQVLLRKSRFTQAEFPALRWLQQAGGWLPDSCIREITRAMPSVRFYVMYGQTEATARLSYLPPERLPDKLGSIGRGLPSTRLEVIRPDGTPVCQGTDEIGEIVASGGNVSLGYWGEALETAQYFRDGRLHTGDLARVDADGFIYLVDRERDIIKAGGHRISAREIETIVSEAAGVVAAGAVGVPHDVLGEAVIVFVSVESPSTVGNLLDHCRRRLPVYKVPEAIVHLAALPQNESGKLLKAELRRLAASLFGSEAGVIPDERVLRVERKSASVLTGRGVIGAPA